MTPAHEEILTRLQAGTRVDRIADLVGVDRRTVIGVAHQHRYRITRHGTAELIGDQPVTTAPLPGPRPHSNLGTLAVAVNELTRHKDPRVAKAASKCREQLVKLIDAVSDYDEKAEARAEVERLEAQLAEAKAKLRRTPPSIGQPDVDSKKVRAWAAENGVDCPRVGRVPQHVVEQYLAAA